MFGICDDQFAAAPPKLDESNADKNSPCSFVFFGRVSGLATGRRTLSSDGSFGGHLAYHLLATLVSDAGLSGGVPLHGSHLPHGHYRRRSRYPDTRRGGRLSILHGPGPGQFLLKVHVFSRSAFSGCRH